jgi:hypothetical protein
MSVPRLAGLILLVELGYVSVLAFAVPARSGAVALALATTFLLAIVISRRVGRCQPTSTAPGPRTLASHLRSDQSGC